MRLKILLILSLLLTQNTIADVYYCADIDSNGFYFQDGKYQRSGFKTDKFKINFNASNNSIVLKTSEETKNYICEKPPQGVMPELLICNSLWDGFNFNIKTGRYVESTAFGFVSGDGDSIDVSYGQCDKFD